MYVSKLIEVLYRNIYVIDVSQFLSAVEKALEASLGGFTWCGNCVYGKRTNFRNCFLAEYY